MSRNIRLLVEFDGADFFGWQRQPELRTVEGVLTAAIASFVQHPVRLVASSRTDRGVHALRMPVAFNTTMQISAYGLMRGLNSTLPPDVKVHEVEEMPADWRLRYSAVAKTYLYRYQMGSMPMPLWRRRTHHVKRPSLDVERMIRAAPLYEGTHDFAAFRAAKCQAKQTVRRIYSSEVRRTSDPAIIEFEVTGSGFLQYMVRIMAGTLLQVGLEQRSPATIPALLASGDRTQAGPTLNPQGLTLVKVFFQGYPKFYTEHTTEES